MKIIRALVLPVITVLIVIFATFLPQYLSDLQDQRLEGQVHTERLTTENNIPTHSTNLIQRLELLFYWKETYDIMSAMNDIDDDALYDQICATVLEELNSFVDAGLLPQDLLPKEFGAGTDINRLYLQRQQERAEYYMLETYSKTDDSRLMVVLDRESGHILWLELDSSAMEYYFKGLIPSKIGSFLLHRLPGLESSLLTDEMFFSVFKIQGASFQYCVSIDNMSLRLYPALFYPETDTGAEISGR